MKTFSFVLILVFLINCKEEKTFADDVVLTFPKDTKMTIQEFNTDSLDFGSNVIYKGILKDSIQIKYYKDIDWIPAPPPPIIEQENSDYLPEKSLSKFFYDKPFQGISSESIKHTDDLNLIKLEQKECDLETHLICRKDYVPIIGEYLKALNLD